MPRPTSDGGEPTLDLHGMYVREALRRVDAFVRAEQSRGTVAVRIVTGHGTGALKQAVGAFLAGHPSVARVSTPLQGDAVRVAVLRPPLDSQRRSAHGR